MAEVARAAWDAQPVLSEWQALAYSRYWRAGRDMNGRPLYSELRLIASDLADGSMIAETEDILTIYDAMSAEEAAIRADKRDATAKR